MVKKIITINILIAILVSCTRANQPEPLPTVIPTIAPTPTLLLEPSTSSDEPTLVFFVSEQGKFEAWMPVSGDIAENTITRTLFGKTVECSAIFFSLNSAGAMIEYCDLAPAEAASSSAMAIINEVRDIMKREMYLMIDDQKIEVIQGSYPALTISGKENMGGNAGTFKARIILAGNRVYFVHMYVYHIDWCNCLHQMDQVVESFYVEPDLSIPFEPTPTP